MKVFPKLHTWREWRFELASLQSTSFSAIKKKKKTNANGSDLIASVFCSFPTRPAFTCTEIIKLTRWWGGWNADTIAFRK